MEVVAQLILGHLAAPADLGQLAVLLVHDAQLLLVALAEIWQHRRVIEIAGPGLVLNHTLGNFMSQTDRR